MKNKIEFWRVAQGLEDDKTLSYFEHNLCVLSARCSKNSLNKIIKAFPEKVKQLTKFYKSKNGKG